MSFFRCLSLIVTDFIAWKFIYVSVLRQWNGYDSLLRAYHGKHELDLVCRSSINSNAHSKQNKIENKSRQKYYQTDPNLTMLLSLMVLFFSGFSAVNTIEKSVKCQLSLQTPMAYNNCSELWSAVTQCARLSILLQSIVWHFTVERRTAVWLPVQRWDRNHAMFKSVVFRSKHPTERLLRSQYQFANYVRLGNRFGIFGKRWLNMVEVFWCFRRTTAKTF